MTRNATNGNKSINIADFCYKPISDKVKNNFEKYEKT